MESIKEIIARLDKMPVEQLREIKKDIFSNLESIPVEHIVEIILGRIVTYQELREASRKGDCDWGSDSQKSVMRLLTKKDDDSFASSNTVEELQKYLYVFPNGNHVSEAKAKVQRIQDEKSKEERNRHEREKMLQKIKEDINEYDTDDIIKKFDRETLESLCSDLGINVQMITNYREPPLKYNNIPQNQSEIPEGYTDVFFWGIPSSGKTCALSAIFSTIKKDYSMEAPDCDIKFGATYRDSLINIFRTDFAYLPGRTSMDKTQYMPFLLYKRGEKKKRKISFFELSGEVFKYFYEVANNAQIITDFKRDEIERSFQTLELLLRSNNQKIHYFFIDYNQETKHAIDSNGLTQGNYLEAAATYFRDAKDNNNKPVDIFKKKTDAVYVIITKSDEIRDLDRFASARSFLNDNFGAFMDVLENQCDRHSVYFNVKLFSIGDVYFKKICRINREYSSDIINDLLQRVKPSKDGRLGPIWEALNS